METEINTYSLLSSIVYPGDLRKLKVEQLPEVCRELRRDIIDEVSRNPGHFAASLGTVELALRRKPGNGRADRRLTLYI